MTTLEHIGDGSVADRNFRKLMGLLVDTGGQSVGIRFGSSTYAWPGGSPLSTTTTIDHGLGSTPVSIIATPWAQHVSLRIASRSATQITVVARTLDGSSPVAASGFSFGWMVLG